TDTSVGRTPAALAAWLGTLPGLSATTPQAITLGGLSGVTLDVAVNPTWTRACPDTEGVPAIKLFVDVNPNEGHDVDVRGDAPMRVILLDLGDSRSLLIYVQGKDKAAYAAVLPEAMPIITSSTFPR